MFDVNKNYFVPLHKMENYGFAKFVDLNSGTRLIKCKLEPYSMDGYKYKLYAVPVEPADKAVYDSACFYTSDFEGLIKYGHVVPADENTYVELVTCAEPIGGAAYIIHTFEVVRGGNADV